MATVHPRWVDNSTYTGRREQLYAAIDAATVDATVDLQLAPAKGVGAERLAEFRRAQEELAAQRPYADCFYCGGRGTILAPAQNGEGYIPEACGWCHALGWSVS